MAADFEISSLSGTGTATIRVKPKAVNEDMNNIKEQVLKVVVQGVEDKEQLLNAIAAEAAAREKGDKDLDAKKVDKREGYSSVVCYCPQFL